MIKAPVGVSQPLVAIDFDGTLTTYKKWQGVNVFDPLQEGARESVQELKDRGYRVLIWTTRNNVNALEYYLRENNVPFDFINTSPVAPSQNPGKPACFAYIDDNAIRHFDWQKTMITFNAIESKRKLDYSNWSEDFRPKEK